MIEIMIGITSTDDIYSLSLIISNRSIATIKIEKTDIGNTISCILILTVAMTVTKNIRIHIGYAIDWVSI